MARARARKPTRVFYDYPKPLTSMRTLGPAIPAAATRPHHAPSAGLHPQYINDSDPKKDDYCRNFAPKTNEVDPDTGEVRPRGGRSHTGSCPITWGWKQGKPVLRFCSAHRQQGRIIPVDDAVDAMAKAQKICEEWYRRTGPLPEARPGKPRPYNARFQLLAREMSDAEPLRQYALGRSKRVKRRSR
jgi:hypothetical protein